MKMALVWKKMVAVEMRMEVAARTMAVVEVELLVGMEQQQQEWDVGICRRSRELASQWVDDRSYLSTQMDSSVSVRHHP
jgi:hypothetical protein